MRPRKVHRIRTIFDKKREEEASKEATKVFPNKPVVLDISNKNLESWSGEISKSLNVNVLDVSKNKLQHSPSLQNFSALEELNLSRNIISDLMATNWSQLQKLVKLDISRNHLFTIPDSLFLITSLQNLQLHHNQIEVIPDSIERLRLLQVLDLSYNNITSIGNKLEMLVNLDSLNLSGNPEITDMGVRAERLVQKRSLLTSKADRRILIQRALCIRKQVLNKEQEQILNSIRTVTAAGNINMYP